MRTLISWLGDNDFKGFREEGARNPGAVAEFLGIEKFDRAVLLHNRGIEAARYCQWLEGQLGLDTRLVEIPVKFPHDFDAVYQGARDGILGALAGEKNRDAGDLAYLLSSGTKAMSSALLLIGCSDLPGKIYYSWEDRDGTQPDPAQRYVHVKWPERFSLALFATRRQVVLSSQPLEDHKGRELSNHRSMKEVYARARKVAATDYPVLIQGETGTGKEILADYIIETSSRARGPRVNVNCGAIPESLVDAELFGYRKGAFTGAASDSPGKIAAAHGGTIFLDEVGELPAQAQVRLLRFLQEGEIMPVGSAVPVKVDVRVIAASHRDLRHMVQSDTFRSDLYFRLARYPLVLPPLLERGKDLHLVGRGILNNDEQARGAATRLEDGAWKALEAYDWPGNIRELQNILIRCAVDARDTPHGRLVDAQLVRRVLREQGLGVVGGGKRAPGENGPEDMGKAVLDMVRKHNKPLRDVLEMLEAATMQAAIEQEPKQKDAAKLLGYSEQNFSSTKKRLRENQFWPR